MENLIYLNLNLILIFINTISIIFQQQFHRICPDQGRKAYLLSNLLRVAAYFGSLFWVYCGDTHLIVCLHRQLNVELAL